VVLLNSENSKLFAHAADVAFLSVTPFPSCSWTSRCRAYRSDLDEEHGGTRYSSRGGAIAALEISSKAQARSSPRCILSSIQVWLAVRFCRRELLELGDIVKLTAIFSDIHSNIEALTSVIKDAEEHGVERFVCLGDVIGYGPCPTDCVDVARSRFDFTLLGNHEEAVLFGAIGFNPKAKAAVDWTRAQLHRDDQGAEVRNERWQFLGELPLHVAADNDVLYVHGSPRDPTREYIFPTDVLNPEKLHGVFTHVDRLSFNGHTHAPGVMSEDGIFRLPQDVDNVYVLDDEKVIINVGSVGQPRDGDNRSSYAIFDGERITFRRVAYDIDKTVAVMNTISELPEYLALRLKEGR